MPTQKKIAAWMALCLLSGLSHALAQELPLPPEPESPLMPSALGPTQYDKNQARLFGAKTAAGPVPFQWGPFALSPDVQYQFTYGNGLLAAPGHPSTTATQTISTDFLLAAGNLWTVDYTPSWQFYSNPAFHDTVDQRAGLQGNTSYDDWNLGFSQGYSRTSEPLVETGRQTLDQDYTTGLNASYSGGGVFRVDLALSQSMQFSPIAPDTYQWTSPDWLHYDGIPQMDAAIGPEFGYTVETPGGDMEFVKPEAQLTWRATDQLDLNLVGGYEHEEFISSGGGSLNSPTMSATVDYVPWETTTLSALASRDIEPALAQDLLTRSTQFSLSLRQRLLGHFFFGATYSREKVDYVSTGFSLATLRGDRLDSIQLSLGTTLFNRCSVALQYSNSHNASSATGFGFSSFQYGFSIGYKF